MHGLAALGAPMQLAFVPKDIDRSLHYWAGTLGAGPFFHLPELSLPETRYRGVRSDPVFSLWLGYWGDMQIELIRQHNDAPSIYRDAADDQRLHHICLLVESLGTAMATVAGAETMQTGEVPGGGAVAYVQPEQGPLVELLQPAPGTRELFAMMREAHRTWDGRDPVRAIG